MSNTPRMDEETERLIQVCHSVAFVPGGRFAREKADREARNALRLRIQQLLSEARAEGFRQAVRDPFARISDADDR